MTISRKPYRFPVVVLIRCLIGACLILDLDLREAARRFATGNRRVQFVSVRYRFKGELWKSQLKINKDDCQIPYRFPVVVFIRRFIGARFILDLDFGEAARRFATGNRCVQFVGGRDRFKGQWPGGVPFLGVVEILVVVHTAAFVL